MKEKAELYFRRGTKLEAEVKRLKTLVFDASSVIPVLKHHKLPLVSPGLTRGS